MDDDGYVNVEHAEASPSASIPSTSTVPTTETTIPTVPTATTISTVPTVPTVAINRPLASLKAGKNRTMKSRSRRSRGAAARSRRKSSSSHLTTISSLVPAPSVEVFYTADDRFAAALKQKFGIERGSVECIMADMKRRVRHAGVGALVQSVVTGNLGSKLESNSSDDDSDGMLSDPGCVAAAQTMNPAVTPSSSKDTGITAESWWGLGYSESDDDHIGEGLGGESGGTCNSRVWTEEEILSHRHERLVQLRELYNAQFQRLQYELRQKRRRYDHARNESSQIFAENSINKRSLLPSSSSQIGVGIATTITGEALGPVGIAGAALSAGFDGKKKWSRSALGMLASLQAADTCDVRQCCVIENGTVCEDSDRKEKCTLGALPLSQYCLSHILLDKRQKLFTQCENSNCSAVILVCSNPRLCDRHQRDNQEEEIDIVDIDGD